MRIDRWRDGARPADQLYLQSNWTWDLFLGLLDSWHLIDAHLLDDGRTWFYVDRLPAMGWLICFLMICELADRAYSWLGALRVICFTCFLRIHVSYCYGSVYEVLLFGLGRCKISNRHRGVRFRKNRLAGRACAVLWLSAHQLLDVFLVLLPKHGSSFFAF